MPDYRYTALDRSGQQVTGTLVGRDDADAAAKVRALGYYPVNLRSSGNGAASGRAVVAITGNKTRPIIDSAPRGDTPAPEIVNTGRKVPRIHILLFTRELADLIDAGLPIDRALSVLVEQSDSNELRAMVTRLQGDIRAGKPLSEALVRFPREFPALYANMIRAGEISGQLPGVMTRLADFMEKEQIRRSQVVAALTYPMVLVTVAVLAVTFLLTFVIPKLQDVFKDLGAALPLPTQMLLGASKFVQNQWWVIAIVVVVVVFGFKQWVSTPGGRRTFDGLKLNMPVAGTLTQKMVMARFVRTLGTLLGGGVPILDSLEIAGSAVGNTVTEAAIGAARDSVRQGEPLAHSLSTTGAFAPLVVHMSAVGEETGRLPNMLIRTSETLDFEVDNAMRRLTSLVEPAVVLLMGGFVGFVVLSVLLPIFKANTFVK